ncbi:hypothetical protein FWD07_02945 [Candidatus Saccharibacteria bacterium]|nr:hypothetical protein [Candidatus Saccharibacteria bacterium]
MFTKEEMPESLAEIFKTEAELGKKQPDGEVMSNMMFCDENVMTFGYVGRIAHEKFNGFLDGFFAGVINGAVSGQITCEKSDLNKADGDSTTSIYANVKGEIDGWFYGLIKISSESGDDDSISIPEKYFETYQYLQNAPLLWRDVKTLDIPSETIAGLKGLETIGSVIEAFERHGNDTDCVMVVLKAIGYEFENEEPPEVPQPHCYRRDEPIPVERRANVPIHHELINPHYNDSNFSSGQRTVFLAEGFGDPKDGWMEAIFDKQGCYIFGARLPDLVKERGMDYAEQDKLARSQADEQCEEKTALWYQKYLSVLINEPTLKLVHILAGVKAHDGYSYLEYGYVVEE